MVVLASATMPEERNSPSTRFSRWSETNVLASSSGLKVVRLRLIAQEVKQYLQGYWSHCNPQILNVQRAVEPCCIVEHSCSLPQAGKAPALRVLRLPLHW